MANAIVHPVRTSAISRSTVAAALRQARTACANNSRWLAAVNRAALNLEACRWAFGGEVLVIESATTPGLRYTVSATSCSCKAAAKGTPCWHRAARRLLVLAATLGDDPTPTPAAPALALVPVAEPGPPAQCPMCGETIESRQVYIGGKGYCFVDVCSGDGSHYSKLS